MKINEQNIVETARRLCDEENQTLQVKAWKHRKLSNSSTRLITIPAAIAVGFVLGICTNKLSPTEESLMTLVDTVYVNVKDEPADSSVLYTSELSTTNNAAYVTRTVHKQQVERRVKTAVTEVTGVPMQDDQLRYDLLARN